MTGQRLRGAVPCSWSLSCAAVKPRLRSEERSVEEEEEDEEEVDEVKMRLVLFQSLFQFLGMPRFRDEPNQTNRPSAVTQHQARHFTELNSLLLLSE